MNLSGKIGVWGFGKEGQSLFKHLEDIGGYEELTLLLDGPSDEEVIEVSVLVGNEAVNAIKSGYFDIIFKSPGISLYKPEIKEAKENGTIFSSATNLWFEENTRTKKIVVTATKGKSTTASILYHVMKEMGLSVSLAGNVGIPLLSLKEETEFTVIELSSYQLADLKHAPDFFVILNLFPEHLQWHLTHENYYNDKLSPLSLPSAGKVIANANNKTLKEHILKSGINVSWFGREKRPYIKTQLKGGHNQDNIDAVLTVCKILDLNESEAVLHIEGFVPLSHRLQEFTSKEGRVCVNDSISTTPESALAALKVYDGKDIVLILGGTDRGQDYSELINYIKKSSVKAILLLPKNGVRLAEELKAKNVTFPIYDFPNLEAACTWIKKESSKETVALLSPAAPSYDQFKNFEERGALFIKLMS